MTAIPAHPRGRVPAPEVRGVTEAIHQMASGESSFGQGVRGRNGPRENCFAAEIAERAGHPR